MMKTNPSQDQQEIPTNQERHRVFLRYINRGWLIFGVITLMALPFFPQDRDEYVFLVAIIFPSYLIVRSLNLSGRTWLAGVIFTCAVNFGFYGLFLILARSMGADEAFRSQVSVWMLMGLAVLFAGTFVDKWAAPIVAAIDTILLIATRLILAPQSDPRPSVVVFWWMMALIIWLYERTLQQAIAKTWDELAERKQAEAHLRANAHQYQELFAVSERQARELILLHKVRSALARELDLSTLLRSVVQSISETFGYTQVSLYLLENDQLHLQHQIGYENVIIAIPLSHGVSGRVVRTGQALLIEDVRTDTDFLEATAGVVSEVCVPLFDEDRVVGVLNVESTQGVKLTDADLQLMIALGEHIGVAISRARLYSNLQKQNRALFALQAATLVVMEKLDLNDVLPSILLQAAQLINTNNGYLYLIEPDESVIKARSGLGTFTPFVGTVLKPGEGLAGKIWQRAQAMVVDDYHTWPERSTSFDAVNVHAVAGVPIIENAKVVGVLGLSYPDADRKFSTNDIELLSHFAQLASLAVKNAQLYSQVQQELLERKQVEETLLRFRNVMDDSNDAIFIIEPETSRYIDFNKTAYQFLGYTADELKQLSVLDIAQHITGLPHWHERVALASEKGGLIFETMYKRKDGTLLPVEVSAKMLPYETEKSMMVAFVRDITERKKAEATLKQSEERNRILLENLGEGVCVQDREWRFTYANPAAHTILGWSPGSLIGRSEDDIMPLHSRAVVKWEEKQRLAGNITSYEVDILRPDGETRTILTTGVPHLDDDKTLIETFVAFTDITERKRAEAALKKLNAELEQRVAERTAQLETANKELEAFSYSVSHDLRAPLRAIDGYSRILAEDFIKQLPEEAQQYLKNIRAGSQKMGELINDLLALSRITRQTLKYEQVNLSNIAHAIVQELKNAAPERSIEFIIANGLTVQGDPGLLQILLDNLLNNAWKYSARVTKARIEFGITRLPDGSRAFFVRDNGAGFNMAHADKLFGAFQRLHTDEDFEGTGIGLATVQRIIQRHGGRVWAKAEVDKGAVFYFTL